VKILILKPSSLGDVIQALPVLRLLKRRFPESRIYWWLSSDLLALFEEDPQITGLFPFERRRWARPWHWPELIADVWQMRALEFDWIIDLQGLARSGWLAWFANGALTVGVDDPREGAGAFHDVAVPRPSSQTHAVDWYLSVLPRLGVPVSFDFEWLPVRSKAAAAIRQKWPVMNHRWIALQPGARWLNKRWPVEHFIRLVQRLAKDLPDHRFAILGSRSDVSLTAPLLRAAPGRCVDLANQTTLPEMIEWLRSVDLLITNDTGPMHVAAAMNKPVVALFGPTDPRRTGPYGQLDRAVRLGLACSPCLSSSCRFRPRLECLEALRPDRVGEQVLERLAGRALAPPPG
jgi:heptosyltransferase I